MSLAKLQQAYWFLMRKREKRDSDYLVEESLQAAHDLARLAAELQLPVAAEYAKLLELEDPDDGDIEDMNALAFEVANAMTD